MREARVMRARAGAAPRNWHRPGALLHLGKPDKDLDEKAARKIHAYRELHRDIAVSWTSCRPSTALQAASIAGCCACCFCTHTGRRHASSRFWTTSTRNHTHLGLLTAALLSSTPSRARQVSWSQGLQRSGSTSTPTAARSRPRNGGELQAKLAPLTSFRLLVPPHFRIPVIWCMEWP